MKEVIITAIICLHVTIIAVAYINMKGGNRRDN